MAIHANLRWRYIGHCRVLDIIMAIAAVDTEIAGVKLMTVRHGLDRTISDIGIFRGAIIPDKSNNKDD